MSEQDDQGNFLLREFGLCEFRDHQTLSIQEMPEISAPGQLPRSIDVIVKDNLVEVCMPGDCVAIMGIYKAIPGQNKGSMNGVFRLIPLQSFSITTLSSARNIHKWSMERIFISNLNGFWGFYHDPNARVNSPWRHVEALISFLELLEFLTNKMLTIPKSE